MNRAAPLPLPGPQGAAGMVPTGAGPTTVPLLREQPGLWGAQVALGGAWRGLAELSCVQSHPQLLTCPRSPQGDNPDPDCVGDPGLPGTPGIPGERGEQVGALPIPGTALLLWSPRHPSPARWPQGTWLAPWCHLGAGRSPVPTLRSRLTQPSLPRAHRDCGDPRGHPGPS